MTGENPPPAGLIAMAEVQCPVAQPDRATIIANGTNQRRADIMAAFQTRINDIYPSQDTPANQALYQAHVQAHGPPTPISVLTISIKDYANKTNKAREDCRISLAEITTKYTDELEKHYLSLDSKYRDAAREHDTKCAAAVKVFQERLSQNVLELVDAEIQNQELRMALWKLDTHYASIRGGAKSMNRILTLLDGITFMDDGIRR
jgi:hypothetical protein